MNSSPWKSALRCVPVLGILACVEARAQWSTQAWARSNSFRETNAWWATVHTFVVTNYTDATNAVITTNIWRSNIYATNWNTNAIANTWTIRSLRWTNGVATNFAYTVTDTNFLTRTNLVQSWSDRIQLDCILALEERFQALPYAGPSVQSGQRQTRFYHQPRENLALLKDFIASDLMDEMQLFDDAPAYVSPTAFSNALTANALYATNVARYRWNIAGTSWAYALDTTNDLRVAAALPSNYFAATFYRDLFATNSYYRNVMTCRVTFAEGVTGTVTNVITDCCGNTNVAVVGTNRQVVTIVCTNASILPGYTAADYNFHGLRRAITNLSMLVHVPNVGLGGIPWIPYGGTWTQLYYEASATNTSEAAVAGDVVTALASAAPKTNTSGAFVSADYARADDLGGGNYGAQARESVNTYRFTWSTPFDHTLRWYASGIPVTSGMTGAGLNSFNDLETSLTNQPGLALFQTLSVTGTATTALVFTNLSNIASTNFPAAAVGGRAHGLSYNPPLWFSWPMPTTNGFRYR